MGGNQHLVRINSTRIMSVCMYVPDVLIEGVLVSLILTLITCEQWSVSVARMDVKNVEGKGKVERLIFPTAHGHISLISSEMQFECTLYLYSVS